MMRKETVIHHSDCVTDLKVECLSRSETYPGTSKVDVLETQMSWIFLTDGYVYKLKKPVLYHFLDFRTVEARYKYCMEEARINQALAGDTYLGVIPLKRYNGMLQLDGKGETIDWLVKMKRLPEKYMLDVMIKAGTTKNERIQLAAEKLINFYLGSSPVELEPKEYRQKLVRDIESNGEELLKDKFALPQSQVVGIITDLLHFVMYNADLFDQRVTKIRECHGDLRPEHICLVSNPVIIDRIEFDSKLRIMDIAEELSFLMLECEMLGSASTGQLFMNVYKWKNSDKIPEPLMSFYKAKRAFLRAWLEDKYQQDDQWWRDRCHKYLQLAQDYCRTLS